MFSNLSPDGELVIAITHGNEEAMRLLYERYDPQVDQIIKALLRAKHCFAPNDHAEGVKSETWQSGYKNIGDLEDTAKFIRWMRTIASNFASKHLRYCIRQQTQSVPLDTNPHLEASIIPLEKLIEGAMRGEALLKLADEISPKFGHILRLRLNGYDLTEIPDFLGESYVNVRNIYYRSLPKFNEERARRGL